MHYAAINNHTEILEYIVEDLQMKEMDKEDEVSTDCFQPFVDVYLAGLLFLEGCDSLLPPLLDLASMRLGLGSTALQTTQSFVAYWPTGSTTTNNSKCG